MRPMLIELRRVQIVEKYTDDDGRPLLEVEAMVLDKNTQVPLAVKISRFLPPGALNDPPVLAREVRRILVEMVTHEVDELVTLHGEQLRDPHARFDTLPGTYEA